MPTRLEARFSTRPLSEQMDNRAIICRRQGSAKARFRHIDPVGKWIEVDGHQFEITGVMQRRQLRSPARKILV